MKYLMIMTVMVMIAVQGVGHCTRPHAYLDMKIKYHLYNEVGTIYSRVWTTLTTYHDRWHCELVCLVLNKNKIIGCVRKS
ncbi:uncharacterized protein F4822DRAFT_153134 [Hypoxylon trugodes]|uniref:uncharacterized protein n=1 Tax=Hypoxylon trugodes TaxID=326681 RepID=UPI0021931B6E|nr:uncharacterized protein F4822DRAFT_153134 [Hypoxylon trugodes]KAI1390525.1 hypothetical protein F4822DRAFT_153134 [Hypoxylon trugodes]